MTKIKFLSLFAILLIISLNGYSCSTYKVTVGCKTMYGMNYDTWLTSPRIWFENTGYGAVFTGANYQGGNDLTPQSGMNEFGLSFGTLATPTPENGTSSPSKKQIRTRSQYLKHILHSCKTVEEVKAYIEQYDHSSLANDVFLYIDKSGKYLIVEPYTLTLGNDDKYVLANFCPSTVNDFSDIKQQRYINGTEFLKHKIDTSLSFCTALSDTMHVCRERVGDGTLLTTIWDLNNAIVHLYFYHNYEHRVQFDLSNELAKGDHYYDIVPLFPRNTEYQQLLSYKTPMNSTSVHWILFLCAALFLISFPYFLVSFYRNKNASYAKYKLLLSILSLCMAYFMFCLLTEMGIYYFTVPYKHYKPGLINIAVYLPYLMLLLFIPLLIVNKNIFRDNAWKLISMWLFAVNNFAYLTLIILFAYWGFFNLLN